MKIKEVENMLKMNAQTIRYYDKLGFLNPKRDDNGYRNYTMEDIKTLKKIRFLRELDFPLEMVKKILFHQDEFQSVLETHIKTLQTQVNNLEEIQHKCISLNQKNIPLLDAVVDGDFPDISTFNNKQIQSLFQKAIEFMEPYHVITIGRKTTPYQFLKEFLGCFCIVTFVFMAFIIFFKKIKFMKNIHLEIVFLSILIVSIIMILIIFKEKYYEFKENDFYIFDSHQIKLKSIKAILNNSTHHLAKHYYYKDIDYVRIVVEKKLGGLGFGPMTYYNIIYQFHMLDNHYFEINSSLYNKNDQDRNSVYEILKYHNIKIIDKYHLDIAFSQNEITIYQYLEKNIIE